jgi:acyl carrier protein
MMENLNSNGRSVDRSGEVEDDGFITIVPGGCAPPFGAGRDPVVAANVASFARAGVVARIKHVLVTVSGVPLDRMVESSSLEQDLELNSLERVEAGMALEEEFGLALSDDEVDQVCMGTIGGIADYLMTQRGVE